MQTRSTLPSPFLLLLPAIPSHSTSALQLLGKSSPAPGARGIPRAAFGLLPRLSDPGAAEGAPPRGRLSLETRCQQPDELAGNVRGSLQMPWKTSLLGHIRLGGPWDSQGPPRRPAADWEVARFSTSELEKAVLGIILGTVRHENLHDAEAIKSKTMYFETNQAGETPCSLPRPQNGEFFPDEVNLSVPWKWGKPLPPSSRRPLLLPFRPRWRIPSTSSAA